jgi:hypothetical protein
MDTEIIAESQGDKVENRKPTRREERAQERRMRVAVYVGIGLFAVVLGLVALTLVVEPAPRGTDTAVLQAPAQRASSSVAVESEPVAAEELDAPVVEPAVVAQPKPEVQMPTALVKLVNERMSATDRDRFKQDWAAMNRGDRIEYLRQLGYDVTTL